MLQKSEKFLHGSNHTSILISIKHINDFFTTSSITFFVCEKKGWKEKKFRLKLETTNFHNFENYAQAN